MPDLDIDLVDQFICPLCAEREWSTPYSLTSVPYLLPLPTNASR